MPYAGAAREYVYDAQRYYAMRYGDGVMSPPDITIFRYYDADYDCS